MKKSLYNYSATVIKIIDGDTIDCTVDLGFNITINERFRLYGVDTPEKNSTDLKLKELSENATKFVSDSILGKHIFIDSTGKDKYGRWLATIHVSMTDKSINEQLIDNGFAKAYFGDNKLNLFW